VRVVSHIVRWVMLQKHSTRFAMQQEIYHDKGEPAKESFALRNEAYIIGLDMHRAEGSP
jgi:hypothetical protein